MNQKKKGLKGAQATGINKSNYAAYVDRLRATGEKFPCNQKGTVSIEGVANIIGCTTKVLTKGSLTEQFDLDVEAIGVEVRGPADSKLAEKAEAKAREASNLTGTLSMKIKETENLKAQLKLKDKKIRELEMRQKEEELSLHELLKTGRRFTL